ncbi:nuclear transport factor 2 family protein [Amphritea sp. 1_MG-2023]|uniref:nuclear transport factor 2 family protein n=1 Tax=Amphritea sp. 1_MG-2023 TaxID=3062670 RepID=UPI0026E36C3B|nr:nuclear transport factor 2 family protein [Amphritea sp. 1_MG-2023]MDO6563337.1 nuclear transport factor 2 family protein [Amphritea sp. 1_MG-2023]
MNETHINEENMKSETPNIEPLNAEPCVTNSPYVEHLERYAMLLSQLKPERISELGMLVSETICFTDPFNRVQSKSAFLGIMADMFEQLDQVSFEVFECQVQGEVGYLYWRFSATSPLAGAFKTEGVSRLVFDQQGRVVSHQDFWDASLLMEQFPLLGRVIRYIRRRAAYRA